ncbi:hypothetical protein JXB01_02415 [Candidatus Micrarchaeota archaeon]|nr:hypothetical protein [Candidatus Micrarchaeota archaeon]
MRTQRGRKITKRVSTPPKRRITKLLLVPLVSTVIALSGCNGVQPKIDSPGLNGSGKRISEFIKKNPLVEENNKQIETMNKIKNHLDKGETDKAVEAVKNGKFGGETIEYLITLIGHENEKVRKAVKNKLLEQKYLQDEMASAFVKVYYGKKVKTQDCLKLSGYLKGKHMGELLGSKNKKIRKKTIQTLKTILKNKKTDELMGFLNDKMIYAVLKANKTKELDAVLKTALNKILSSDKAVEYLDETKIIILLQSDKKEILKKKLTEIFETSDGGPKLLKKLSLCFNQGAKGGRWVAFELLECMAKSKYSDIYGEQIKAIFKLIINDGEADYIEDLQEFSGAVKNALGDHLKEVVNEAKKNPTSKGAVKIVKFLGTEADQKEMIDSMDDENKKNLEQEFGLTTQIVKSLFQIIEDDLEKLDKRKDAIEKLLGKAAKKIKVDILVFCLTYKGEEMEGYVNKKLKEMLSKKDGGIDYEEAEAFIYFLNSDIDDKELETKLMPYVKELGALLGSENEDIKLKAEGIFKKLMKNMKKNKDKTKITGEIVDEIDYDIDAFITGVRKGQVLTLGELYKILKNNGSEKKIRDRIEDMVIYKLFDENEEVRNAAVEVLEKINNKKTKAFLAFYNSSGKKKIPKNFEKSMKEILTRAVLKAKKW